jgi:hypothetical protein
MMTKMLGLFCQLPRGKEHIFVGASLSEVASSIPSVLKHYLLAASWPQDINLNIVGLLSCITVSLIEFMAECNI